MKKKRSISECALCRKEAELRESHIIPKFFINYTKKHGNGYLRNGKWRRMQDGYKFPLLCHDCEQFFSKYEKYFAENFFKPYKDKGIKNIEYDDRLYWFIASMFYRYLLLIDFKEHNKKDIIYDYLVLMKAQLNCKKDEAFALLEFENLNYIKNIKYYMSYMELEGFDMHREDGLTMYNILERNYFAGITHDDDNICICILTAGILFMATIPYTKKGIKSKKYKKRYSIKCKKGLMFPYFPNEKILIFIANELLNAPPAQ